VQIVPQMHPWHSRPHFAPTIGLDLLQRRKGGRLQTRALDVKGRHSLVHRKPLPHPTGPPSGHLASRRLSDIAASASSTVVTLLSIIIRFAKRSLA